MKEQQTTILRPTAESLLKRTERKYNNNKLSLGLALLRPCFCSPPPRTRRRKGAHSRHGRIRLSEIKLYSAFSHCFVQQRHQFRFRSLRSVVLARFPVKRRRTNKAFTGSEVLHNAAIAVVRSGYEWAVKKIKD